MDYVLGFDQGGTKTLAAVADTDGNILSVGRAPGGYHAVTGMEHAIAQMKAAAQQALERAGLSLEQIRAIGAGMTGADFEYEYRLLEDALTQAFRRPNVVVNDSVIALRAETSHRSSLVICAGTGVNITLWAPDGRQFIYGFYIDDPWQGGSAIGRRAIALVIEADLGLQPDTLLTGRVLEYFDLKGVDELIEGFYTNKIPKDRIKELSPVVDRCALEGDAVALAIQREFATAWARYALAGMVKYDMLACPVTVYLSGSVFKTALPHMRDTIAAYLQRENPAVQVLDSIYEPLVGGVSLALEKGLGGELPKETLGRVYASAKALGLLRKE